MKNVIYYWCVCIVDWTKNIWWVIDIAVLLYLVQYLNFTDAWTSIEFSKSISLLIAILNNLVQITTYTKIIQRHSDHTVYKIVFFPHRNTGVSNVNIVKANNNNKWLIKFFYKNFINIFKCCFLNFFLAFSRQLLRFLDKSRYKLLNIGKSTNAYNLYRTTNRRTLATIIIFGNWLEIRTLI